MPRIGGGSIGAPGSGSGTGSVRFADLPTGWVITHRGAGSAIAPENTVEAFRIGAAYGTGFVDGGDWEITTDGALVMAHDPTVDRLTTSTGNANDLTAIQASRLVVDAGAWFGGGFGDTRFVTAEEMFGIYGRTAVLSPEPKSLAAVAPLVALIKRLGLQASVFPTAFNAAWLAPFQAAGCANVLLNITAPPTQAELDAYKAQGITWIGVPWQGTVVTPANVATIKANGFKVMAGTTNRQADYQPLAASGVDGWASDDPLYFAGALNPANVAKYRRATDPFKSQAYYHGHITSINSNPTSASDLAPLRRGTFLGGNRRQPLGPPRVELPRPEPDRRLHDHRARQFRRPRHRHLPVRRVLHRRPHRRRVPRRRRHHRNRLPMLDARQRWHEHPQEGRRGGAGRHHLRSHVPDERTRRAVRAPGGRGHDHRAPGERAPRGVPRRGAPGPTERAARHPVRAGRRRRHVGRDQQLHPHRDHPVGGVPAAHREGQRRAHRDRRDVRPPGLRGVRRCRPDGSHGRGDPRPILAHRRREQQHVDGPVAVVLADHQRLAPRAVARQRPPP
jgi:glycerophosphoryl diester phosphodiesterase